MPTNSEFSDVRFADKSNSTERQQGNLVKNYGYDPGNSQFSSKMTGDPISLLESTRADVLRHADMNQAYGLNQPVAGIGIHHWLRDSFVTPDDSEPGNSEPGPGQRMPGKET